MLKCEVIPFFKLRNNTAAELHGVPANGTILVALNPQYIRSYGYDWTLASDIQNGTMTVIDVRGNECSAGWGWSAWNHLYNEVQAWSQEMTNGMNAYGADYLKAQRLHWNLSAQHALMDLIGEDVLCTDFTSLGVTKAATIEKMEPAYALVMQGMFSEAAALVSTFTADGFFTAERIALYHDIIAGADAFAVTL